MSYKLRYVEAERKRHGIAHERVNAASPLLCPGCGEAAVESINEVTKMCRHCWLTFHETGRLQAKT